MEEDKTLKAMIGYMFIVAEGYQAGITSKGSIAVEKADANYIRYFKDVNKFKEGFYKNFCNTPELCYQRADEAIRRKNLGGGK